MRTLSAVLAAALLVPAGTGAVSAQAFGAVGTTETVPCPSALTQGAAFQAAGNEVEGQTYSCGVVVVPENHDQPDGRTIELFYLKLHATDPSPSDQPMVYLAGGPGSSGSHELTINPLLKQNLDRIRRHRDILAYDQRGTGFSDQLLCAPFESALGILQDRDANPEIAQVITDLQATVEGAGYRMLRQNLCGAVTRLLGGVDLAQFNSVSSAKDIPMLVTALGYTDGYSLYGTSYGTRLAQFAMRAVPEGITGAILDGVSGTAIPNAMWSYLKNVSPYEELAAQCAADAACDAAYPKLGERFGALLERLETDPLVFDPPLVVNPPLTFELPPVLNQIDADFFNRMAAIDNIVYNGGLANSMPRIIKAVEDRDVAFFRASPLAAKPDATSPVTSTVPVGTDPKPAFAADQPLYEIPFLTLLGIAQTAAAHPEAGIDTQWLAVALGDLSARLAAGENQADLMEALLRLVVVPNIGTTAQALIDYANGNLSTAAAAAANAVAGQMDRDDARATLWSIQDIAMQLNASPDQRGFSDLMQTAVNCADEIAFTSFDVAKQALADSTYPQLAAMPLEVVEATLAACLSYPSPLDRSVTEPVTSDIPVLIYNGGMDNETPVAWGRDVAKTLSNVTVVEWPNQGHVIAAHDQQLCAGDIADAFLGDPSTKPDVSCSQTDTYKLPFTLP